MFELTIGTDDLGLQSLSEMPGLYRYHHRHYRRSRKNVCLVTANHSLNGINILNILNGFGSW
jgi:hypothetical protein